MDRKNFLITSALTALSVSTFGKIIDIKGKLKGDCKTTNDILGPYYRKNAPVRSDLIFPGLDGTRLTIEGQVFQSDCTTPINDVTIEIWHCDSNGRYDNSSSKYNHRGIQRSDEKGKYTFQTILPGKYMNGSNFRPSHIHFRITSKNTKELVSQIYFSGDPNIKNDPWASNKSAVNRTLDLVPVEANGSLTVYFNIYLENK